MLERCCPVPHLSALECTPAEVAPNPSEATFAQLRIKIRKNKGFGSSSKLLERPLKKIKSNCGN